MVPLKVCLLISVAIVSACQTNGEGLSVSYTDTQPAPAVPDAVIVEEMDAGVEIPAVEKDAGVMPDTINFSPDTQPIPEGYKSFPLFNEIGLGTDSLAFGNQAVARIGLSSKNLKRMSFKQLTFRLTAINVSIGDMKFYRNGQLENVTIVGVASGEAVNLEKFTIHSPGTIRVVVTAFDEMLTEEAETDLIELRAGIYGLTNGSKVSIYLVGGGGPNVSSFSMGHVSDFLDDAIIWSDCSSPNHSLTSNDWIGGRKIPATSPSTLTNY